jgi:prepilin-type N-terminal cleavage/methylation domain-containing protein
MRAWVCRRRGEGGFTLMELMISVAILGLVMAGLLGLLTASRNAYSRGSSTIEAQQNARLALERMGKEIREAGYHPRPPDTTPAICPPGKNSPPDVGVCPLGVGLYPSGGGSDAPCWCFYPIVAQTATALTLQYDWNGDGVITTGAKVNDPVNCPTGTPCRGEQVTYSLSGTTLMRQEVGDVLGAQPVATGISALTFTYWMEPDKLTVPPAPRLATSGEAIRSVQIVLQVTTANAPPTTITMMDQIRLRTR